MEEVSLGSEKVVKITGIEKKHKTVTVLMRGSNKLVLDEADRLAATYNKLKGKACKNG